jgi:Na+-driven multidrug efflux pump
VGSFDTNREVIREGVRYLRICCSVNFIAYASMYIFDSLATGVGDSLFAMINALLHSVVMRLSLSYLLGHVLGLGFIGIYWGEMLSPLLSFLVGISYFLSGVWKGESSASEKDGSILPVLDTSVSCGHSLCTAPLSAGRSFP